MSCSLCKQPEVDNVEFECGNGAGMTATLRLCESHFKEYEKDEYTFQDKHAELLDKMAYEDLIDHADMLRDGGL